MAIRNGVDEKEQSGEEAKALEVLEHDMRQILNLRNYKRVEECVEDIWFKPARRLLSVEFPHHFFLILFAGIGPRFLRPFFHSQTSMNAIGQAYSDIREISGFIRRGIQNLDVWWTSQRIHRLSRRLRPFADEVELPRILKLMTSIQLLFQVGNVLNTVHLLYKSGPLLWQVTQEQIDPAFSGGVALVGLVEFFSIRCSPLIEQHLCRLESSLSAPMTQAEVEQFDVLDQLEKLFEQGYKISTLYCMVGVILTFGIFPLSESERYSGYFFILLFIMTRGIRNYVSRIMDIAGQREARQELATKIYNVLKKHRRYIHYHVQQQDDDGKKHSIIEVTPNKNADQSFFDFFKLLLGKYFNCIVISESEFKFSLILMAQVNVEEIKKKIEVQIKIYEQLKKLTQQVQWDDEKTIDADSNSQPVFVPFDNGGEGISWSVEVNELNLNNQNKLHDLVQSLFPGASIDFDNSQLIIHDLLEAPNDKQVKKCIFDINSGTEGDKEDKKPSAVPHYSSSIFTANNRQIKVPRTGPRLEATRSTVDNNSSTKTETQILAQAKALCDQAKEDLSSSLAEFKGGDPKKGGFFALVTPQGHICCVVWVQLDEKKLRSIRNLNHRDTFKRLLTTQWNSMATRNSGVTGSGIVRCGAHERGNYKLLLQGGFRSDIKIVNGFHIKCECNGEKISAPLAIMPMNIFSHQQYGRPSYQTPGTVPSQPKADGEISPLSALKM